MRFNLLLLITASLATVVLGAPAIFGEDKRALSVPRAPGDISILYLKDLN